MPRFLSASSRQSFIEKCQARRDARVLYGPLKEIPEELHDIEAKIAELHRVRQRLVETHQLRERDG